MTISAALNNALSGLGATSRSMQVVSSNIANALTPGYGRREIELATHLQGGVRVAGVARLVEQSVLTERRIVGAELGGSETRSSALRRLADTIGATDRQGSISATVARFETALTEAASSPDSEARLASVAHAGRDVATALNAASTTIQDERLKADQSIAGEVGRLRTGLAQIDSLNEEIVKLRAMGQDTNGLLDQRQQVIDGISDIVPMRELPRQNGAIAIVTDGGQVLLDSRPVEIAFTPVPGVSAAMTLGAPLSGLTVGGREVDMGAVGGRMSGGTLAAHFDVRDRLAPEAQAQIDGLARDLVERVSVPGLDPTAVGRPGLFTDEGGVFAAENEPGLAGRVALNEAVDPNKGGEPWRLRDGLYAAGRGPEGDASLLRALSDALSAAKPASSASLSGASIGFADRAGRVGAEADARLFISERNATFASARSAELVEQEIAGGVDTDQEMQKLLLIEQSYGANAKVIQAVDAMIKRLLEI